MPYTKEEGGILNNFAREPKMYQAEPPSGDEKRNFAVMGALGAVLVASVIAVAAFAS